MLYLAFHYDGACDFNQWAHLVEAYCVDQAYVLGLPQDHVAPKWNSILSLEECPTDVPRILLSPQQARYQPGEMELSAFVHPDDALYIFGSNNISNPAIECDTSVYIPVPHIQTPLYAAQAAVLLLNDRWTCGNY